MENTAVHPKSIRIAINPSYILEVVLWFIFVLGLLMKCTHFQFSTKINIKPYFSAFNNNMFLSSLTSVMILAGLILLFFNKKRLVALFVLDIVMTLLLLADTLYFRYYYNAITVPVLYQIGLVSSITDSAKSLFRTQDLIFAIDIPLFIAGLSMIKKFPAKRPPEIRPVKRIVSAAIVLCISFGLFQFAYGKSNPGAFPYDNNYVINDLGIFYFHYYDVKRHVEERYFADHTLEATEKTKLNSFFDSKKASGNLYEGAASGKNLIIVQMEAIQQFVINTEFNGKEITPNLNKYINESTYLDNFYYQVGTGKLQMQSFLQITPYIL